MEKSKRVFITKLQLGLPWTPMQRQQKGASNSGFHCLYRVFSGEKCYVLWKGQVLGSDWFSFPGLAMGSDWFPFPRFNLKVLNIKSGDPDLGSDWLTGGGVRSGDFPKTLSSEL